MITYKKKKMIYYNGCSSPPYSVLCFLIKSAGLVCVGDSFCSELIMEAEQNNKILPTEITNYNNNKKKHHVQVLLALSGIYVISRRWNYQPYPLPGIRALP